MVSREILLIGGKPGSGKSTASKTMLELEEAPENGTHLSVGERLRAISDGTIKSVYASDLLEIKNAMAHDKSVPHDIAVGVVGEYVSSRSSPGLVIVDGLRAPDSLTTFRSMVEKVGARVLAVCEMYVEDEIVFERISRRVNRHDNVVEDGQFITRRLETYRETMVPTLELMKQRYPYHILDGSLPADQNARHLLNVYNEHSNLH